MITPLEQKNVTGSVQSLSNKMNLSSKSFHATFGWFKGPPFLKRLFLQLPLGLTHRFHESNADLSRC